MDWQQLLLENWHVKLVSVVLVLAAYIDGRDLKVPNWITFPMVLAGLVYNTCTFGWAGLGWGLVGMFVGLLTLLPLYSVGGMGAGDVKLMAGIGAWLGWSITLQAFAVSVVVGAVMAVLMVVRKKAVEKHYGMMLAILHEWFSVKDPRKLSATARERKPTMMLLPYGIPICIGSIGFFWAKGMLV